MGIERLAAAILLLAALIVSCGERQADTTGGVDRYELTGTVVRVDLENKTAVIKHDPIQKPGGELWMDAMTMEFPVRDAGELEKLQEGRRIRATLFQRPSDLDYWLGEIEAEPGEPVQ